MSKRPAASSSMPFYLPCPRPRTPRTQVVAEWFGLPAAELAIAQPQAVADLSAFVPAPGKVVLITGPSGAGKSSLLRAIHQACTARAWLDLQQIELPDRPLVDCFGRMGLERVLGLLSRVGLAEAWTYLRTPSELSEGQRWRLRLALSLAPGAMKVRGRIVVCDEFAAVLDRVSAAVVARALRRTIARSGASAIVATSHDDLLRALLPYLHVKCDFGTLHARKAG
jgi:ABC-type ATPase with predicted acetyltransferase domain